MRSMSPAALPAALLAAFIAVSPVVAAEMSEQELMAAAENLGKQYDETTMLKTPPEWPRSTRPTEYWSPLGR